MTSTSGLQYFGGAIIDILAETLDTHHGLYLDRGTSLFETLATVSAADASRPVSASCASITAQVNHVTYYLDVLNGDLSGKEVASVNWNAAWTIGPVDSEEWAALIGQIRTAADATMASRDRTAFPRTNVRPHCPYTVNYPGGMQFAAGAGLWQQNE